MIFDGGGASEPSTDAAGAAWPDPKFDPEPTDGASVRQVTSEAASLFVWHRRRWGAPWAALLRRVSDSGATVVIGTDRPLRPDRTYALRLPDGNREPIWTLCSLTSQDELGRGLYQVNFQFASHIVAAEAA